jgi:hypothetical protein
MKVEKIGYGNIHLFPTCHLTIRFCRCFLNKKVHRNEYMIMIGTVTNGELNGPGILCHRSWIYIGDFVRNSLEGAGIQVNEKTKYCGDFLKNQFHGFGEFESKTGIRYVGEWFYGNFHGKGTITCPGKKLYRGQWKIGKSILEIEQSS